MGGWKKWKVGDWFGNIEKDRTPIPHGGRFEHPDDGGLSGGAGYKYVEGKVLSNKVEELMNTGTNCYNPVKYPELSIAHHLSRRYTTPYLKTFFTDMGANVINMQRHIDNHIEYLQGKRTYAETYEAPPKAHAYV